MTKTAENHRPAIGITIGDAAGIGPEIVLKSVSNPKIRAASRCVLIGDAVFLRELSSRLAPDVRLLEFRDPDPNGVEIFDVSNLGGDFDIGVDAAVTGRAAVQYIETAVELWRTGQIAAIATAPISKRAIKMAGYNYPGHTELLATLTATSDFRMSFFADKLRVVLLSTHLPLISAIRYIDAKTVADLITFTDREMSKLLGRGVRLAVAGLNPHASEDGMFGTEEAQHISPAIDKCRANGIDVTGPYSPDTIFLRGHRGEFDAVLALYHDQATIAVKSIAFGAGVNVTLGLPLIRTSVDHGTAFDIAGQGIAEASSMEAAISLAGELASVPRLPKSLLI